MPFIYKPSLWGFVASAIFIILMLIEFQNSSWIDALMWALLAFSFSVKYLPKFVIFRVPGTLASFAALVFGGVLFIIDASDKLGQN